jgi:osmotically-inducible protein OsmY
MLFAPAKRMRRYFSLLVLAAALGACDITREPAEDAAKDFRSAVNPKGAAHEQARVDAALSSEVKRAIEQNVQVKPDNLHVEAADGVVTLNGEVLKAEERQRAALLTLSLEGVRSVVNNLVVVQGS